MSAPVVTQADREAAAQYVETDDEYYCNPQDRADFQDMTRGGELDGELLVQAFARHRTAAEAASAASAATVAELVEALDELLRIQRSNVTVRRKEAACEKARAILARAKATSEGEG